MITRNRIDRFSPTAIQDYISCPKLFYYRHVAKIKLPKEQIHLVFGSAIHKGLEGLFNGLDPYVEFEKSFLKEKLLEEEYDKFDNHLTLGKDMLKNYLDRHDILCKIYGLDKGISEEYKREKIINPISGEESSLPMSSMIDRKTDNGIIVDFKTAKDKSKWKPNSLDDNMQEKLYSLRYFSDTGRLPEKSVFIVLLKEFNKYDKSPKIQVVEKTHTKQDLAQTFEYVELIINKINNNEFGYPQSYHPPYCDCYTYEKLLNFNKNN